jgi:Mlc titration factor MtfA (ptsG expression regulator)
LEEHPLHHLERDIRTEIQIELTKYLIAYRTNSIRIANSVHRFQMELEVLQKAAIIWKSVWPNETRIDEMVQTSNKLVCSTSSQQREQLMLKWEEHRNYVQNWIHNTWIQEVNHKRHYYSAGLTGVCVLKAIMEINTKLEYYDDLTFDEQQEQKPYDVDLPEDLWNEDMYFYAACAAAEGLPYKMEGYEVGIPEKFYGYWKWWLLEAIPRSI